MFERAPSVMCMVLDAQGAMYSAESQVLDDAEMGNVDRVAYLAKLSCFIVHRV